LVLGSWFLVLWFWFDGSEAPKNQNDRTEN